MFLEELPRLQNEGVEKVEKFLSADVFVFTDDLGNEIEVFIYQYRDRYEACTSIYEDCPPFRHITTKGVVFYNLLQSEDESNENKMEAIKIALTDLYEQAYEVIT